MVKLSVMIGKLKLGNPVMVASGTFGYAREFESLVDLKKLGAIVTKTITQRPRAGNPPPRIVETPAGMLNSIGLQNEGVDSFLKNKPAFLFNIGVPIITSIAGDTIKEYAYLAKALTGCGVSALEINISCPNVIHGGKGKKTVGLIAQDAKATFSVVKAVRQATKLPIITKLSPNVTDITTIAKAAKDGGTDALSLINTFYGMSIDINTRRPRLGNVIGGVSGPAIRPMAVKMVLDVKRAVNLPIIGMGGIMDTKDALEFIIAGASAIALGTANFINPHAAEEIVTGIEKYLKENRISDINKLIASINI
ncbi:MAG: dihydroorotate dehydrogenase [Candidatus Omnitrophota bacterium]